MDKPQVVLTSQQPAKRFEPQVHDHGSVRANTAGADSTGEWELGGWYCAGEFVPLKQRS
jgi:hypothetical protein